MMRRSLLLLGLLLLVGMALPGLAVDKRAAEKGDLPGVWPQWRGPKRDGISMETGLLKKWPKDGPSLAWSTDGLGKGFSSVAVVKNVIYTMGDMADGQYILALNLADGKQLWTARVGDVWDPNGYSGPRCTPTIDGGLIYAVGTHGDLVCVDDGGKEVWRRSYPKEFGGRMHSGWGFSESPLIDGQKLVCTPGGPKAGIVALDKKTGADLWQCAIPKIGDQGGDGAAYSSLVVSNAAGVKQYVQLMGRGVVGVAAKDGKFLWGYNKVANGTANIPTPLVQDDYVFCSSGYGAGAALLKITASGDDVNAEQVYFLPGNELQNHHGGMIMLGDCVYLGHGHNAGAPTCVEWMTGKTVWREKRGPGGGSAAIAYADGNLYFRYQDGVMALVGATPDGYEEKGTFKIPNVQQPSWPHPVIAGGKLYLREQDNLYVYNLKK